MIGLVAESNPASHAAPRTVTNLIATPDTALADGPVSFVEPLLGFPDDPDFELAGIDPNRAVYTMRSTRQPALRFILSPAPAFFPDYAVDAEAEVRTALGVPPGEALHVLLVLTVPGTLAKATANLLAPVVIAATSRRAIQLLLVDSGLPLHAPLIDSMAG